MVQFKTFVEALDFLHKISPSAAQDFEGICVIDSKPPDEFIPQGVTHPTPRYFRRLSNVFACAVGIQAVEFYGPGWDPLLIPRTLTIENAMANITGTPETFETFLDVTVPDEPAPAHTKSFASVYELFSKYSDFDSNLAINFRTLATVDGKNPDEIPAGSTHSRWLGRFINSFSATRMIARAQFARGFGVNAAMRRQQSIAEPFPQILV